MGSEEPTQVVKLRQDAILSATRPCNIDAEEDDTCNSALECEARHSVQFGLRAMLGLLCVQPLVMTS